MPDPGSEWGSAFAGASLDAMQAYDRYVAGPIFVPCTTDLMTRAQPEPGEAAIDVATGTGIVARALAARVGPSGRVMACDISPAMLAIAQGHEAEPDAAPIEWVETPAAPLAAPDEAFDLVTCQQGIQFFPDRPAALGEIRRTLRDGGRAYLAVWDPIDTCPLFAALAQAIGEVLGAEVAARYPGPWACDASVVADEAAKAGFGSVTHEHVTIPISYARFSDVTDTLPAAGIAADYLAAGDDARSQITEALTRIAAEMEVGGEVRSTVRTSIIAAT